MGKKVVIIVISLVVLSLAGWIFYEFVGIFAEHIDVSRQPALGTPAAERQTEQFERIHKEGEQIHKARTYEEQEKYDLAITEYKKALEMVEGGMYEGMVRGGLSICYEKTGQYKLALEQINWLLGRKVASTPELLERKQRIEKLLQEQK